jgi:hypothetical protein
VAVDNSGRALAIWNRTETLGGGVTSVRGSWFTGTWSAPELLDETGTGSVSDAVLAMDGAGNAEVAWIDGVKGLVERRFTAASSSWGSWNPRSPSSSNGNPNVRLDMSDSGHAVLISDYFNLSPIPWTMELWAWVYTP